MTFKRIITFIILVVVTSFYLFPVSLVFLPESLNTKIILAGFGIVAFLYDGITKKSFNIPRYILYSGLLAFVFSLWCLYCVAANGTDDMSYASYWVSFFTWLFGAYAVCFLIREMTGKLDLGSLSFYLATVCLAQCILAEWIDHSPSFQQAVDRIFVQGQELFHDVKRLYGIGAALDTAGVRFSVVLVLIAHQLSRNEQVIRKPFLSAYYITTFSIVTIIGSIIARTTWIGAALGLLYLVFVYFRTEHGTVSRKQIRFWSLFLSLTLLSVVICVILYRINPEYRNNLRFGFEGFFNWAETGVFSTGSTDKLNQVMWIWPEDTRTWIIGKGLFGNWVFSTDIGYCRFTLYCGLVGLCLFSLFFIYNGLVLLRRFPGIVLMAVALIFLTFIIWVKVATDIFFIYALFYWLPEETESHETVVAL